MNNIRDICESCDYLSTVPDLSYFHMQSLCYSNNFILKDIVILQLSRKSIQG